MTGIDLLRWSQEGVPIKLHTSATDLLIDTYPTLCQKEISATIVLAHALDIATAELDCLRAHRVQQDPLQNERAKRGATGRQPIGRNFWLTLWSSTGLGSQQPKLQLVLSCTTGHLGDFPVFLWSSDATGSTANDDLDRRLQAIQSALLDVVHPQRVFSVFGRADLVTSFKKTWTSRTGVIEEPTPFYGALLTYCTKETFRPSTSPPPENGRIRMAELSDLTSVTILCREFADTSVYFPLTPEGARREAQWLIGGGVVWVYDIAGSAVSICAVARQSDRVAVVTKVYTKPEWRRKGFAEALARKVTEEMLTSKQNVALYVGVHNDAQHIYDRIGYVGLCGKIRPSAVEEVLEVGFCGTERGHW